MPNPRSSHAPAILLLHRFGFLPDDYHLYRFDNATAPSKRKRWSLTCWAVAVKVYDCVTIRLQTLCKITAFWLAFPFDSTSSFLLHLYHHPSFPLPRVFVALAFQRGILALHYCLSAARTSLPSSSVRYLVHLRNLTTSKLYG